MNNEIEEYEDFAYSREEFDSYVAPALMKGYRPRHGERTESCLLYIKRKLSNKQHIFHNFKLAGKVFVAILGLFVITSTIEEIIIILGV